MSLAKTKVGVNRQFLGGTVNLAFFYKDGVMAGVDTRIRNVIHNCIVSDLVKKFRIFENGIVATMGGKVKIIYDVWEAIGDEVRNNSMQTLSVDEASKCAFDFIKDNADDLRCYLFIIGKHNEELKIWLVEKQQRKPEPKRTEIKTWKLIGKGTKSAGDLMRNHHNRISEEEGLTMARRTLLAMALTNPSIGGYIIILKVLSSTGTSEIITREPVPSVLLCHYDLIKKYESTTIFLLSADTLDDKILSEWFSDGSIISPVKAVQLHTLGKVRGGYYFRKVVIPKGSAAAVCAEVSAICRNSGFSSGCTEPIISELPFLYIFSALFYFGEASKELLANLCYYEDEDEDNDA